MNGCGLLFPLSNSTGSDTVVLPSAYSAATVAR